MDMLENCTLDDTGEGAPATEAAPRSSEIEAGQASIAGKLGKSAAIGAVAINLTACGGASSDSSAGGSATSGGGATGRVTQEEIKPETDAQAARFALHASLSVSPQDISDLKAIGYEPWLDRQMDATNAQSAAGFFESRGFNRIDTNNYYSRTQPADAMIWSQLMAGGSGVRKRIALALSEFFVVSLNSVDSLIWRSQGMGAYWDMLNNRAFGNFRDLLEDVSLAPVMGVYLNTRGNRKADARTGRVPDENFGREIMQLFSIGLHDLNIDGTDKTDASGQPIETYDNEDVTGIAKVFTGYDLDFSETTMHPHPSGSNWEIPDPDVAVRPMTADASKWRYPRNESFHSPEEKSFLGTTIPAGTGPAESLAIALDTLFNHPNVGPFFGKQMIQRLVTSNPSPAYVTRVAQAFNDDGTGKRGNLRAVFKAILLDEEALSDSGLSDPRFGKLREPMLRYIQWARTVGVQSASSKWDIGSTESSTYGLAQSPLRSPSVFNYFRPAYFSNNSQAAANDMVAPEFQLVNETTVAAYLNFMQQVIRGKGSRSNDVKPLYSAEIAIAHDRTALLDRLDLLLTGNQMMEATRSEILSVLEGIDVTQASPEQDKLNMIYIAVMLVMASYDYLIQR